MKKIVALTLSALLISACNTSGAKPNLSPSTKEPVIDTPEVKRSYEEQQNEYDHIVQSLGDDGIWELVPLETLPQEGSASYQGVGYLWVDHATEASQILREPNYVVTNMLTDANVKADFSNSTLTGSMTNFRKEDNSAVEGHINFTNEYVGDAYELGGSMTGEIGVNGKVVAISGVSHATVLDNANAIQGGVRGETESGDVYLSGHYLAVKQ